MSINLTGRWPMSRLPVSQITPFTYKDGETYLSLLHRLSKYVTEQLHPNLRETVEHIVEEMEVILADTHAKYVEGIQQFQQIHDAFMEDVNSALMALNDSAVADLVSDDNTALGSTLRELFTTKDYTDTQIQDIRDYVADEKAKLWVDVTDYGATGDGVTDDTEAIRDAINAAPETGTVFFPRGVYKVGNPEFFHSQREMFHINKPLTIQGAGAVIQDSAIYTDDRTVIGVHASDTTVTGLTIKNVVDGVQRPVHRAIGVGFTHTNTQNWDISQVTIENCVFHQAFYPIQVRSHNEYSIRNVRVTDNRVYGIPGENCGGIMFQSTDTAPLGNVSDVIISNNHVYGVSTAAAIGLYGVHNFTVTGNYCDGSEDIGAGIQTERAARNGTITGNTLLNHYQAVWVHDSNNVSVTGNSIANPDNRHGAQATGIRVTVQGLPRIQPFFAEGISLVGNTIQDSGIRVGGFSTIEDADTAVRSLVISGNSIVVNDRVSYGIQLTRRSLHTVIQGNYVDGSNVADILLQGNASYPGLPKPVIVGNILYGHTPLEVQQASYVGRFPFTSNHVQGELPDNVYYQETIGDKQILVMSTANQQAPVGTLGMARDGKLYKKTGEGNTEWTEI